jgi:hypothetical protein
MAEVKVKVGDARDIKSGLLYEYRMEFSFSL